jgi:hypothetical protein
MDKNCHHNSNVKPWVRTFHLEKNNGAYSARVQKSDRLLEFGKVERTFLPCIPSHPHIFATKLIYLLKASHKTTKITHGSFCFPLRTYNFSVPRNPHMAFLVELDVVGREQTGLAAEVAEPPVVVGKFLERRVSMEVRADI